MKLKKFENFSKINEEITVENDDIVSKVVQDYFEQKIVYATKWMVYSESDIQDELLPKIEALGCTFDVADIEYDENLLKEVASQMINSVMNSIRKQ